MCARVHGVVVARDAVAAGALALAVVAPRAVRAALQHVQLIWRQNHTFTHSDACKHHGLSVTDCPRLLNSGPQNAVRAVLYTVSF